MDNFEQKFSIRLDGLLVIKTKALIEQKGNVENLFKNLVEGCFSGFEGDPKHSTLRPSLKQKFFKNINGIETHCDPDFNPLIPIFVDTSSQKN
ncbi:MAG: hypothetical protein IAX21_00020 [Candidatus Bathyarchaeota archaeon]|nr:MAG: hypothetical protein IAX21_00020 [Candidatus Bathyarchaeota archaeon]